MYVASARPEVIPVPTEARPLEMKAIVAMANSNRLIDMASCMDGIRMTAV
jgi:hypothetical protein